MGSGVGTRLYEVVEERNRGVEFDCASLEGGLVRLSFNKASGGQRLGSIFKDRG